MNIALFVDIGVVVILLISAGVSFFRGLIREVLTIFGALGAAFSAYKFGGSLKPMMRDLFGITEGQEDKAGKLFDVIPMTLAADFSAYALVFIAVFIALQVVSHFLSSAAQAAGLGPIDRTLGVFFGLARGIILLGILYIPFHYILSDTNKKEWLGTSKTIYFVEQTSNWVLSLVPNELDTQKMAETAKKSVGGIDILGDKRITIDEKEQIESKGGYAPAQRETLDKLIENKANLDAQQPQKQDTPHE